MEKKNGIWTKDFILMCMVSLFMSLSFYFLMPVLPIYINQVLKSDNAQIGLILSIYTVSALLIRPFTGFYIDKYGRKYIFIFSFVFFSAVFSFYSYATTFMFFFILRLIHGFAWGVMSTTSSTIIIDILPLKKRGEGLGYFGLAMTIAMALGPFIAVSIIGENHNYNKLFYLSSSLCFVGVLLSLLIKYPKTVKNKNSFRWASIFEPKAIIPSLNTMMLLISYGGIISFITIYGKEIGVDRPVYFFMPLAIGLLISRLTSGKIFDNNGPLLIVPLGIILLIVAFPILAFIKNELGFSLSALIMGAGIGVVFPTSQAMVNNLSEKNRRGAANSTLFTTVDIGIGFGMLFIGYISDKISLANSFLICSFISIIGLLYFYFITYPYYCKHNISE